MNLSGPFIRRPVGTSLLAFGLLLSGLVAFRFMPVAPVPRVDFPVVSVSASLPGADPATVAASLATPLERRLGQIAGVTEMTSVSTLGGASVTVQFDLDRKIDAAAHDVQAAINAARVDLPINLPGPPTYRKMNPADAPIMILSLTSDTLPETQLFEFADEILAQKLNQVEGVSQATVGGAEKSAVRVRMNPGALASAGVSLEDVRTLLSQANVNLPTGSFDGALVTHTIKVNSQITEAEPYDRLILKQRGGTAMQLNAFGHAQEGVLNTMLGGWAGTNQAVLVIIQKQAGANIIETLERIRAVLPQIERWMPAGMKISVLNDRSKTIRAAVHDVEVSLLVSIALVVLVVLLFLRRFWPTFIANVAVPLSLSGTVGIMYLLGYSLDNLSLMAITISVGFVVDDAIVVIENIHRHIEAGEHPMSAALTGSRQIGFTVVSMSLSLIAVFIPLLFMGGLVGRMFHEFAVTVAMAILVSGIVSLTVTPMLCSRFLRAEEDLKEPGRFSRWCEAGYQCVLGHYAAGLRWVLRYQYLMLTVTFLTMYATYELYVIVPKGVFPQQDTGSIMGTTEASQDISFDAMSKLQQEAARIVLADPAVEGLGSFIGAGAGNSTLNNGRMFITLKPNNERNVTADQVIERLSKKLAKVVGLNLFLQSAQDLRMGGRMSKAQYQYTLQSQDINALGTWSQRLVAKLKESPKLRAVTSDQQMLGLQMNVVVDRDAASRLGVSLGVIDNTLYDAFGQRQVSTIYTSYNQHYVVLEADPVLQRDPAALDKIYVNSSYGPQVPLSSLAHFKVSNTSLSVNHQGQSPAVTVSFNLAPNASLSDADDAISTALAELHMPSTVTGSFQGTAQVYQASLKNMPLLLLAAVLAIYIVMGMLYESLVHPLTILSTLPSAGVGALLAMLVTGFELSLVADIGIILLMGIVKKNAIMMIDFALDAERRLGLKPEEAIYQACVVRFRPIMMTTLAALFGAIPLAVGMGTGSELRQPLGIAVFGGLLLSQTLTLFTTPVVYLTVERVRLRVRGWWGSRRAAKASGPGVQPADVQPV